MDEALLVADNIFGRTFGMEWGSGGDCRADNHDGYRTISINPQVPKDGEFP